MSWKTDWAEIVSKIKNIHDGKGAEISVAIYNKLVLPCNTDLSACNSQILRQFSPCFYSKLTLRSVGSTIKKRAHPYPQLAVRMRILHA